jgi:hypothetical protein
MAGKNGKRNPKIPPGDQRRLQQDLQKSKLGRSMLEGVGGCRKVKMEIVTKCLDKMNP